ncbi:MAG: hypothetical protein GX219_09425 [Tissierellia bacterium]|nr:hypothetical protein [Tissierellia bacterium]
MKDNKKKIIFAAIISLAALAFIFGVFSKGNKATPSEASDESIEWVEFNSNSEGKELTEEEKKEKLHAIKEEAVSKSISEALGAESCDITVNENSILVEVKSGSIKEMSDEYKKRITNSIKNTGMNPDDKTVEIELITE